MNSPHGNPTDEVLIEMAVAGRSDCFSVLVDRHLPAVRRHLRAMVPNEPNQTSHFRRPKINSLQSPSLNLINTSEGLAPSLICAK
jgi:hypothetical protein